MKKILFLAVCAITMLSVNAASFKWQVANAYASDGTTKWAGEISLYCTQVADWSVSATAASGTILAKNTEFSSASFEAGTYYDFYFVMTDGDKKLTSSTLNVMAQQSDVPTINFGNVATFTQNASNWQAVPEPTSGLLMLLGVAGLALRRRRA